MVTVLTHHERETTTRQTVDVGVEEFVTVGIDDLAKYRIVQLLCARPEDCCDAVACSEWLGLRPIQRTAAELDELVDRHILERQGANGLVRYKLTTDNGLRRRLAQLFTLAQLPVRQGRILAGLAYRSVQRIKAENKGNKRRKLVGD